MTKKQKIWLSVFLAMFVVPEVLWSPVMNMYYGTFSPTIDGHYRIFRNNFLHKSGNIDLWSNILLFQLIGLFFTTIYLIVIRKSIKNKIVYWVALSLLILATIFTFLIHGFSTIRISF